MSGGSNPLVSVVVPLFNGAETIERTLRSLRTQTWPRVEIVVVDDGSTDGSERLVREAAAQDSRIRLVSQPNAGVAAARNRGAAFAAGELLAFVDADDLWAPEKLELQVQALRSGADVGLVYTWSALINEEDRVYSTWHRPTAEGWVFPELCRANFVGNGSCAMITREAFERVGGYDSSLRERRAQGCEDLMIYLRVAEAYEFRVVRRHLTGYRVTRRNMSSDALRMLRSCELTLAEFRPRYPQYEPQFEAHEQQMVYWLLARALTTGPLGNVALLLTRQGFRHAFELAPRFGDLAWLTLKARTPASIKGVVQNLRRRGGAFRPLYPELKA